MIHLRRSVIEKAGRFLVLAVLCWGCSTTQAVKIPESAEKLYQEAQEELQDGRCFKAVEKFEQMVATFPGSHIVDDAQFYLAESHFCLEDYVSARFEYERLVNDYPLSEWVDDAQYKIGLCYFRQSRPVQLDQEDTEKAITHFERFIAENPNSPLVPEATQRILQCRSKLAEKDYRIGEGYAKRKDYKAALFYYESVLVGYEDTKWAGLALLGIGEVHFKQGKIKEALEYLCRALTTDGGERLHKKVRKRIAEMEKESGERSECNSEGAHPSALRGTPSE